MTDSYVFGAGLAYGQIFKLNSLGIPAATSTTAYEGHVMPGPAVLAISQGDPEYVPVIGNDQKFGQHVFPTTDPTTLTLTLSKFDADLHATVTNTLKRTVYGAIVTGEDTNQEGNEPDVAILVGRNGLPADGARWHAQVYRFCTLSPKITGAESRTAAQYVYSGQASRYDKLLNNVALVLGTDGYTNGAMQNYFTDNRLWFAAYMSDGSDATLTFNTNRPAADTTTMGVWIVDQTTGAATERTTNLTKTTTGIEFTSSTPTNGDFVIVQYQLASNAIVLA